MHIDIEADRAARREERSRLGPAYARAVETDDALLTRLRAHLARRFVGRWDAWASVLTVQDGGVHRDVTCWLDEAIVEGERRLILTWINAALSGSGCGSRIIEEVRAFAEGARVPLIIGNVTNRGYWSRLGRSWARDVGERSADDNPNLRYDPPPL